MSNNHVLYALDVNAVIHSVKKGLSRLNEPFRTKQIVTYKEVTCPMEIDCGVDDFGRRVVGVSYRKVYEPVEEIVDLQLNINVTDALASRVFSNLLYEQYTQLCAYLTVENQEANIAEDIFDGDANANHLLILEYLFQTKEMQNVEVEINHLLRMIVSEPWREWKLIYNMGTFLIYGTRDHRILEWEQMTGNTPDEENEFTVNVGHILSYLTSQLDKKSTFLRPVVDTLFMRAMRCELRDVIVSVPKYPVDRPPYEEFALFMGRVLPIATAFIEGTIEKTLPKRPGCNTLCRLEGDQLIFSYQTDSQKFNEEREELLRSMEYQDYVPARLRKQYAL
jgi:hypothetical protein